MKLSIVIPVYNEENLIEELYKRLFNSIKKDFPKFKYELIFIDDGSTDKTFLKIKSLRLKNKNVKAIQFSRNFGHHIAISAGLKIASGDFVVMMDGDLQDQPEEIIKLYNKLKKGYDVVYGIRVNKKFNWFKKASSEFFNMIIRSLIKEKIVINSSIFRIMTKQVVEKSLELPERNRYLVGIIGWIGFSHAGQEVIHAPRFAGQTKYNLTKQLSLAFNAIFAYSAFPLRLFLYLGILFLIISFLLLLISIYLFFYSNKSFFETFIFSTIFFIGGIQIAILGVLGEYIGRLYIENKNRPLYIIRTKLL